MCLINLSLIKDTLGNKILDTQPVNNNRLIMAGMHFIIDTTNLELTSIKINNS